MFVCRLLLHHSRRLLVRWQDLKWCCQSKYYQVPRWYPSSCGKGSWYGAWMGNVFVGWDIHLRAIRYEILIRISTAVTNTETEKLRLWEGRNKTPKHSPAGEWITSSTTIVTMRDRKARALLPTIGTRQCRTRSMRLVTFPGVRYGVWANTIRPTDSLLDVQLGPGPSMGLGPDYRQ